jgi:tmRNA-binding protein
MIHFLAVNVLHSNHNRKIHLVVHHNLLHEISLMIHFLGVSKPHNNHHRINLVDILRAAHVPINLTILSQPTNVRHNKDHHPTKIKVEIHSRAVSVGLPGLWLRMTSLIHLFHANSVLLSKTGDINHRNKFLDSSPSPIKEFRDLHKVHRQIKTPICLVLADSDLYRVHHRIKMMICLVLADSVPHKVHHRIKTPIGLVLVDSDLYKFHHQIKMMICLGLSSKDRRHDRNQIKMTIRLVQSHGVVLADSNLYKFHHQIKMTIRLVQSHRVVRPGSDLHKFHHQIKMMICLGLSSKDRRHDLKNLTTKKDINLIQ